MSSSPDSPSNSTPVSRVFWMRIADNLFRRLWLFIIPVLLFGALGVLQASRTEALYSSSGVLSAASNPLVGDPEIRGTNLQYFESPAAGTARLINEQVRTDAFVQEVGDLAGLSDAIEADPAVLGLIRANVAASPDGNSLLTVRASWPDPVVAHDLTSATIAAYRNHLAETSATDSQEAEEYYRELYDDALDDVEEAEDAFAEYLDSLPELAPGLDRTEAEQLRIDRLNTRISAAEEKAATFQSEIDAAVLSARQSRNEAGRVLQTVDEPQVPAAPASGFMKQAISVAVFIVFGLIVSATALVVTTILDRTVSVGAQLASIEGVGLIATVPPVGRRGHKRRKRNKKQSRPRPPAADGDGKTTGDVPTSDSEAERVHS